MWEDDTSSFVSETFDEFRFGGGSNEFPRSDDDGR